MAGSIAGPASGKTTRASMPLAAIALMSEMDFWVSPCPSAYSYLVMLGHFSASSLPEAVVTWRQLWPPQPSRRASEACFGPHHAGVSAWARLEQPRVIAAAV